jgi:peptidoglycan/LPS O-acetylase OafA/YrhL
MGGYIFADKIDFLSFLQMFVCFTNIQSIQKIFELWMGFAMFWAITVEWQFYILFPFLMRILNRHKSLYLVGIIAVFIIMRGFAFFEGANPTYISYWTILGRMDQFLIGMILAVIHSKTVSEKRSTISMVCTLIFSSILILLALFWFHTQGGVFMVAWWRLFWPTVEGVLWAFFIIGYIRLFSNPSGIYHKMISGIGNMSYSIYLLHWLVIRFFVEHITVSEIVPDHGLSAIIYTIIVIIPVTIILSTVTYTFIEKPFMAMRLRYIVEDKNSPSFA